MSNLEAHHKFVQNFLSVQLQATQKRNADAQLTNKVSEQVYSDIIEKPQHEKGLMELNRISHANHNTLLQARMKAIVDTEKLIEELESSKNRLKIQQNYKYNKGFFHD